MELDLLQIAKDFVFRIKNGRWESETYPDYIWKIADELGLDKDDPNRGLIVERHVQNLIICEFVSQNEKKEGKMIPQPLTGAQRNVLKRLPMTVESWQTTLNGKTAGSLVRAKLVQLKDGVIETTDL